MDSEPGWSRLVCFTLSSGAAGPKHHRGTAFPWRRQVVGATGLRVRTAAPRLTPLVPEIHFEKSGDVHIAYQVVGDGPVDLVWIPDWLWNLELQWEQPIVARFLERLASFSRLLLFDKRGSGLSDRTVDPDLFTLEVRIDDVRAVMDATRSEQAFVLGAGDDGASIAAVFAATAPERTRGLILYGTRAKGIKADDYPFGYDPSASDVWASETETFWGSDAYGRRWLRSLAPSVAHDENVVRWYSQILRRTTVRGTEAAFERATVALDLRGILSAIHVPTLVLHRTGDPDIGVEGGRDLARRSHGRQVPRASRRRRAPVGRRAGCAA